jgi:hypothetical protein
MDGFADILAALKGHPVAIAAAAILILAIASRVISRIALYALMVALIVAVGAFWAEEVSGLLE